MGAGHIIALCAYGNNSRSMCSRTLGLAVYYRLTGVKRLTKPTESGGTVANFSAASQRTSIFSADFPERVVSSIFGSILALITPYNSGGKYNSAHGGKV